MSKVSMSTVLLAAGLLAAARTPADDPPTAPAAWLERAWEDLAWDDAAPGRDGKSELVVSRAVAAMSARPKEVVPFLKAKLTPVKTDLAATKKRIADLGSDKAEVWRAAAGELRHHSPLLVMDIDKTFDTAQSPVAKRRLAAAVIDLPDPDGFPEGDIAVKTRGEYVNLELTTPGSNSTQAFGVASSVKENKSRTWLRLARAAIVLQQHGGPEAVAVLKTMAEGHPDALPTRTAKDALDALSRGAK